MFPEFKDRKTVIEVHHHLHLEGVDKMYHAITQKLVRLITLGENLMSEFSDYVDQQAAHHDVQEQKLDAIKADVNELHRLIQEMQNSGGVTPELRAKMDASLARSAAISARLGELDDLTPPVAPPVP